MNVAEAFEREVVDRVRSVGHRLRRYVLLAGVLRVVGVGVAVVTAQLLLDRWLRLRTDLRAGLLLVVVTVIAWTAWHHLIRPLARRISLTDMAHLIERRVPDIGSRLISALQLRGQPVTPLRSAALVDALVADTTAAAPRWPMHDILDHGRARRQAWILGVVVVAVGAFVAWQPLTAMTWFQRNVLLSDTAWQQDTTLIFTNDDDGDGVIHAPRGDDLHVIVAWRGERPDEVWMTMRFASGRRDTVALTAVGQDGFRHTLPQLADAVELRVRGGDARPDPVAVRLVERPRVDSAVVIVTPPAYAALPPTTLSSGQTLLEVLPGSIIDLTITANKPLASAELRCDGDPVGTATPASGGHHVRFAAHASGNYTFALTDERGLTNRQPRQFLVRLVRDAEPNVRLEVRDAGELITAVADIPFDMTFKDLYGLQRCALVYHTSQDPAPRGIEFLAEGDVTRQLTASEGLAVADLSLAEGARLVVHAEASDRNDVNGPGVGTSAEYTFRVVSPDELLAELARREQEFAQEFQRLISIEERIRADALTLARREESGAALTAWPALQRRQRQIERQVAHVREQFERIYREMMLNQVGSAGLRSRLVERVVQPLDALVNRRMTALGATMAVTTTELDATALQRIDGQLAATLVEMRAILDEMSRWEGFHEAVNLLQSVIRLQREVQDETRGTIDRQFEELFGEPQDDK